MTQLPQSDSKGKRYQSMSIKVDKQLYAKLKSIAQQEGRSINGQVNYVVRRWVRAYESACGPVDVARQER